MLSIEEAVQPTPPATTGLRINLLGPPEIGWAGRPLSIPRRQARALLYRLATHLQALSREYLCNLLWPDVTENTARRDLSHLLTHLHSALPNPEVLLPSDDSIALDPAFAWSDSMEFARLCAARDTRQWPEVCTRALTLYRGPLLAGFSLPGNSEFEAWVLQERQDWERLYLDTLAALVEHYTAQGVYSLAIPYARRYLATDDLAENIHRRLIELYAAVGDRCSAIRQYEQCADALKRDFGLSPAVDTHAVYQAVLEGRSSLPNPKKG